MRRAWLLVVLSLPALAVDERPIDSDVKWAAGRIGHHLFNLSARGHYTLGARDALGFTQGGGELALEGGGVVKTTSFGSLIGFDFDLALGLTQTEVYADGTLRDARDEDDEADPPKLWVTGRFGARLVVAPLQFGFDGFAFRLGALAGLTFEGSGARSWEMPGALNLGAQLVVGSEGFGLHAAYLATPRQGLELFLIRHQVTVDVGLGPLVIGARWQLDEVNFTQPVAATFSSHSLYGTVGFRFFDLLELK